MQQRRDFLPAAPAVFIPLPGRLFKQARPLSPNPYRASYREKGKSPSPNAAAFQLSGKLRDKLAQVYRIERNNTPKPLLLL